MAIPLAIAAAAITAAGSIGGGYMAGRSSGQRESKMEKRKRKLVDELLSSIEGNGAYSDLYNMDEAGFQKSFVDPAKSIFKNQIAPGIQQQYIASGQQRNSGMEDQLLRAGVDLDQLINQQYMNYTEGAKNRAQSGISSVFGVGNGPAPAPGGGQAFQQAASGYMQSDAFQNSIDKIMNSNTAQPQQAAPPTSQFGAPPRKGYTQDWSNVQNMPLNDPRWGR